jgi:hypothetical protein
MNGTIVGVGVDVSLESDLDMEREAAGAMARDGSVSYGAEKMPVR